MPRLEMLPAGFKPDAKDFEPLKERYFIIDWLDEKSVVRVFLDTFSPAKDELIVNHAGSERDDIVRDNMIFIAEVVMD